MCTADRVLAHAASAPSLYVQYHIPGFNEDVLTPVQLPSSNPEFHHTRSFPLSVDTEGLGWMARQRVTFHVFDDSLDANDGDASIGSVEVPLKPLADGHSIEGFFKIKVCLFCMHNGMRGAVIVFILLAGGCEWIL